MGYNFFALISRMKNIGRWALMRNSYPENVQEHSHMVAVIAHALAVISRDVYGKDCNPERAAAIALYHDAPEILTGDMPTPVKYHNKEIMDAYKKIELLASGKLVSTLPDVMKTEYEKIFANDDENIRLIIKAADKMSAYIKCLEELKTGNNEFRSAACQTFKKLRDMHMPEVDYFIENFVPAFELTLDELKLSEGEE